MIPPSAQKLLTKGLEQLSLSLSEAQRSQVERYLSVMHTWNRTFNLTAIRHFDDMVIQHLLDSFAVQPFISDHLGEGGGKVFGGQGGACVDLGSGAGVPGIPLAIMNPGVTWILVDSNGKKTRFLKQVVRETSLRNVIVSQERIESLVIPDDLPRPLLVTARALGSTQTILECARHFLRPGDRILLMKGLKGQSEVLDDAHGLNKLKISEINVPFLDASRFLISAEYIGSPV